MQSLRAHRSPRRAISIEALLVWTFRAQRAEPEPPRDRDRDRPAVGTRVDHLPARRRAGLHHGLLAPRASRPGTRRRRDRRGRSVAGALDWHVATRAAELARAGRRPTCITGPVRCTAAEWHENQHARWPVVAPALPARFPGGVWRPAMKDGKGRERYEGLLHPGDLRPDAAAGGGVPSRLPRVVGRDPRGARAPALSELRSSATTRSPPPCRRHPPAPKLRISSSVGHVSTCFNRRRPPKGMAGSDAVHATGNCLHLSNALDKLMARINLKKFIAEHYGGQRYSAGCHP